MNNVPYIIRRDNLKAFEKGGVWHPLKASCEYPYELTQVLPVISDGYTKGMCSIFSLNQNLIKTELRREQEILDKKFLTADQIELIKNAGHIDVNDERREIKEVVITWDVDNVNVSCCK